MFQEVFDMIPESYRERYGIRLMIAEEGFDWPCKWLSINSGNLAILHSFTRDKQLSVEERQDSLSLKVEGCAEITMYKNFTCILTHL